VTPRELEEYKALRATIAQRGTARICIFAVGLGVWATLALATAAFLPVPLSTLVPLSALAAVFEAVFALHIGVERIGRYVQVFHESPAEHARWESTAMRFGKPVPGTGTDALFTTWFAVATIVNFIPVIVAVPTSVEVTTLGGLHVAFLLRLIAARRAAGRQREADLKRFEQLASDSGSAKALAER
jgi:hypothetical protein